MNHKQPGSLRQNWASVKAGQIQMEIVVEVRQKAVNSARRSSLQRGACDFQCGAEAVVQGMIGEQEWG